MDKKLFEKTPIPVIEIFQSISGEGISAGNLVSFVRTGGCDLRCTWCDTKYSFVESGTEVRMMLPEEIEKELLQLGCSDIICTGGEPLEQGKVKRLLPAWLSSVGFTVHIETSGASALYSKAELKTFDIERNEISYCMDIKCPGSVMSDKNLYTNIPLLNGDDEIKFVVSNREDMDFAMKIIDKYKVHLSEEYIALNFSPVFDALKPVEVVDFLKENRSYFEEHELWARLSLQIHKFVWPPHKRGV